MVLSSFFVKNNKTVEKTKDNSNCLWRENLTIQLKCDTFIIGREQ